MSFNRARFLHESFDSSFYRLKLPPEQQSLFVGRVAALLDDMTPPPKSFFDLPRNVDAYARENKLKREQALQKILDTPLILLDMNNVRPIQYQKEHFSSKEETDPKKRITPSDQEIAQAAYATFKKEHRLPWYRDGYQNLPQDSVSWTSIFAKLKERDLTLRQLVEIELPEAFPKKVSLVMLPDEKIAEIAWGVKKRMGRLPDTDMGDRVDLPDQSMPWGAIRTHFRKQGLSLKGLIGIYPDPHPEIPAVKKPRHYNKIPGRRRGTSLKEKKAPGQTKPKAPPALREKISRVSLRYTPTDREIAEIAWTIKQQRGTLPEPRKDTYEGLSAGSIGWPSINRKLTARGLTIGKLVAQEFGAVTLPESRKIADLTEQPALQNIAVTPVQIETVKLSPSFTQTSSAKRLVKEPLDLALMEESAKATLAATGRRPFATDKAVAHGPLAGKEKWFLIDLAFKNEDRGLKDTGYKGLLDFMNQKNIAERLGEKPKVPRKIILIKDIADSIRATYSAENRRPSNKDGLIKHGALKNSSKWSLIDENLANGNCGLELCPFKSLSDFSDALSIPKNTVSRPNKGQVTKFLSLSDIKESVRETFRAMQWWPSARNETVAHGPLKGLEKWAAINLALVHERRGLIETGYDSLKTLTQDVRMEQEFSPAPSPIHVSEVFQECANYAKKRQYKMVPQIGPMEAPMAVMDKALREGKIEGIEQFLIRRPLTGVIDFMIATGIVERRGEKLVVAPITIIDSLTKAFV